MITVIAKVTPIRAIILYPGMPGGIGDSLDTNM
jgi:hypothetical protein